MNRRPSKLIKSSVLPMVAAAGLAVGTGLAVTPAQAGCSYGSQTAQLPAAQSREGAIVLAAHHEKKCGACGAAACSPCGAKAACAPCNPCAAKNPCGAKSK